MKRELCLLCAAFPSIALLAGAAAGQDLRYSLAGPEASFGSVLETVGDYDGDGVPELFVGEPLRSTTQTQAGSAKVFSGSSGGLPLWQTNGQPSFAGRFGAAANGMGDLDNDGYEDFTVGAPGDIDPNSGNAATGSVSVVSGRFVALQFGSQFMGRIHGAAGGDRFGASVGRIGDLDDDGVDEILVGAPQNDQAGQTDHGMAYVYSGSTLQLMFTYAGPPLDSGDRLGESVVGLNDVSGDGIPDFAAGASGDDDNGLDAGAVYVLSGADGAVLHKILGPSAGNNFGSIIEAADIDGDGIDDVLVAIPLSDVPDNNRGMLRVYRGSDGFPFGPPVIGETAGSEFGASLSAGGDVNGDGTPDILVGARFGAGFSRGRAHLISGTELELGAAGQPMEVSGLEMGSISGTTSSQWLGQGVLVHRSAAGSDVVVGSRFAVDVYAGSSWHSYNYCDVGANSAASEGAQIGFDGSLSIAANNFSLTVVDAPNSVSGLFYYGTTRIQVPFGDGFRCVGGPTVRLNPVTATTGVGTLDRPIDFAAQAALQPGTSWNFQFWYRDNANMMTGFNLSNGLNVTFQS